MRALQLKLTDTSNWNQRHLFVNDDMGMDLAVSKRRCRDAHLLVLMRRVGALVLLTGCAAVNRWLPSELNGSDGPSRVHEPRERQKGPAENFGRRGQKKFAEGFYVEFDAGSQEKPQPAAMHDRESPWTAGEHRVWLGPAHVAVCGSQ